MRQLTLRRYCHRMPVYSRWSGMLIEPIAVDSEDSPVAIGPASAGPHDEKGGVVTCGCATT